MGISRPPDGNVTPALALRGINKRFGSTEALRQVDFTLERGEIHALLGENGAGKSTLMRIAFGMIRPDAGLVEVQGRVSRLRSPVDARRLGIGMVHQHFTSIGAFSVEENIALAAGSGPARREIRSRLANLTDQTGLTLDPDTLTEDLSAGLKQRLEVLKALATGATVLLLDEPSSVLSPDEAEALLSLLRTLRDRGIASVLITHKLPEALSAADRVTVLRRGRVVHTGSVAGESAATLAWRMLGEGETVSAAREPRSFGAEQVRATDLACRRLGRSGTGLRHATLAARAGEIVGIAAIEGNGQRELLRVLAGLALPERGSLRVARPLSFIPEDRTSEGLIADFSLAENLVLSQGAAAPWVRGYRVDWSEAAERSGELLAAYAVSPARPAAPARALSGGNQQRVLIAEALERGPKVLIAENPTRGLDLRATAEVHRRLREAAARDVTVLVHLADLDELLVLADRIMVLASGVLLELPPGASRETIGRHLLGVSAV